MRIGGCIFSLLRFCGSYSHAEFFFGVDLPNVLILYHSFYPRSPVFSAAPCPAQIASAILTLLETEKTVVEGSGACALAAVMFRKELALTGLQVLFFALHLSSNAVCVCMFVQDRSFAQCIPHCACVCGFVDCIFLACQFSSMESISYI
jgi:hypothetical protein